MQQYIRTLLSSPFLGSVTIDGLVLRGPSLGAAMCVYLSISHCMPRHWPRRRCSMLDGIFRQTHLLPHEVQVDDSCFL